VGTRSGWAVVSKTPWPRCIELRKDGSPCSSTVRKIGAAPAEDQLCAHHFSKVAVQCEAPKSPPKHQEPVLEDVGPPIAIESLREALKGSLSTERVAELMQGTLVAALEASKVVYHTCSCGKREPVIIPDLGTRANAVKGLVEILEGRLKETTENAEAVLDRKAQALLHDIRSMSDDELAREFVLSEP